MAHLNINLSKIQYNALTIQRLLAHRDIHMTPVLKCIAADQRIIQCLNEIGLSHFGESRLHHIEKDGHNENTYTVLRAPNHTEYDKLIKLSQISVQTDLHIIEQLNEAAERLGRKHRILLMVDWKDAREGVLTYDVADYIEAILKMRHIYLEGLAFNFLCFQKISPTEEDVRLINAFVNQIEAHIGFELKTISGGNSSMLPQIQYHDLGRINDMRIGESMFRGVDTNTDRAIPVLYQNAITLTGEIIEINPRMNLKDNKIYLQAIVDIGTLDTDVSELVPYYENIHIIGATSDHLMLDLKNEGHYAVGDEITFKMGYKAIAQSMYNQQLQRKYEQDVLLQNLQKTHHHINTSHINHS